MMSRPYGSEALSYVLTSSEFKIGNDADSSLLDVNLKLEKKHKHLIYIVHPIPSCVPRDN